MDLKDLLLIEIDSHYQCIICHIIDTFVLRITLNRPPSVIALNPTLARTALNRQVARTALNRLLARTLAF